MGFQIRYISKPSSNNFKSWQSSRNEKLSSELNPYGSIAPALQSPLKYERRKKISKTQLYHLVLNKPCAYQNWLHDLLFTVENCTCVISSVRLYKCTAEIASVLLKFRSNKNDIEDIVILNDICSYKKKKWHRFGNSSIKKTFRKRKLTSYFV